jgi:hypothetical protein
LNIVYNTSVLFVYYHPKKKPIMTVNALLPPTLNQQDDEVFKMMDVGEFGEFSELNDFLGDIDLHPVDISPLSSHEYSLSVMTGPAAVSAPAPEVPHHQYNTMMAPVSPEIVAHTTTNSNNNDVLPVAPVLSSSSRISPAPSVSSGGESSGDESSVNNHQQQQQQQNRKVPSTVVTTTSIQETHSKNKKAATSSPPQENVQLKKDRRRYV